ncbi:hypothetical protein AB4Z51_44175 [Bradyrhizobium sp. 2TAF36]
MAACLGAARCQTPKHAGRRLKITFGEMREMGVRGVLVYCHCGHHVALDALRWPDDVRLSDLEPRFVCRGCGGRGAEVRPDFERGTSSLQSWAVAAPAPGRGT